MNTLRELLRADAEAITAFDRRRALEWALVIVAGCGVYGITVGIWRAPLQAGYTALKFPLLISLTCAANALLSGMIAQLLGSGLSFRQSSAAILMSFATAAIILGALSPITLFVIYNAPALNSSTRVLGHSIVLLMHVFLIAYAGVVANRRLLRMLQQLTGSRAIAWRVLVSWLAGNLLLGAQLAWVLRPFIGSPQLAVQFLRDDPLRGNFYEAVARALGHLFR
jgi:hypothetical protein